MKRPLNKVLMLCLVTIIGLLGMIQDVGARDIDEAKNRYKQWCEEDESTSKHSLEDWMWFYRQVNQNISPILWSHIQSGEDPTQMLQADDVKSYLEKALTVLKEAAFHKRFSIANSDIAAIISYKTGIPIGKVQTKEREKLLNMEASLTQRVVGQDHAIKSICEAILESRSGIGKTGQPTGSFFFLGPTGTGKTELAKSLAEFLFQDESFMIRFDMSEF